MADRAEGPRRRCALGQRCVCSTPGMEIAGDLGARSHGVRMHQYRPGNTAYLLGTGRTRI